MWAALPCAAQEQGMCGPGRGMEEFALEDSQQELSSGHAGGAGCFPDSRTVQVLELHCSMGTGLKGLAGIYPPY